MRHLQACCMKNPTKSFLKILPILIQIKNTEGTLGVDVIKVNNNSSIKNLSKSFSSQQWASRLNRLNLKRLNLPIKQLHR
jgi:hypothetical protein